MGIFKPRLLWCGLGQCFGSLMAASKTADQILDLVAAGMSDAFEAVSHGCDWPLNAVFFHSHFRISHELLPRH